MILNNTEFHRVQLNESCETIEGREIKRSVMINIRCDDPGELIALFREVKAKLNGIEKNPNEKKPRKKNEKKEKVPSCGCGIPMALRLNKKLGSWFWSCQNWTSQGGGCGMTLPYKPEESEAIIDIDEQVPF